MDSDSTSTLASAFELSPERSPIASFSEPSSSFDSTIEQHLAGPLQFGSITIDHNLSVNINKESKEVLTQESCR